MSDQVSILVGQNRNVVGRFFYYYYFWNSYFLSLFTSYLANNLSRHNVRPKLRFRCTWANFSRTLSDDRQLFASLYFPSCNIQKALDTRKTWSGDLETIRETEINFLYKCLPWAKSRDGSCAKQELASAVWTYFYTATQQIMIRCIITRYYYFVFYKEELIDIRYFISLNNNQVHLLRNCISFVCAF